MDKLYCMALIYNEFVIKLKELEKIMIKNIVFILTVTIILSCCGGNNIATTIHTGSYVEVSRDDNGINLDFSNTLLEAIF